MSRKSVEADVNRKFDMVLYGKCCWRARSCSPADLPCFYVSLLSNVITGALNFYLLCHLHDQIYLLHTTFHIKIARAHEA